MYTYTPPFQTRYKGKNIGHLVSPQLSLLSVLNNLFPSPLMAVLSPVSSGGEKKDFFLVGNDEVQKRRKEEEGDDL